MFGKVPKPAGSGQRQARPQMLAHRGTLVRHEDLAPKKIGWWQEIPTVTPATAIAQCLAYGTPTYLLRQAIERGHGQGYLTGRQREGLVGELEARRGARS